MNNITSDIFVIADGLNTSYIDSLLISLFYKFTHLQDMLIKLPEKNKFIHLQDLIYNNFVEQIRRNFSIDSSILNEIRNYSVLCGWKEGMTMTELYNVKDYLDFLLKGFDYGGINCEIIEITPESQEQKSNTAKYNYLEVCISEQTNTKKILDTWINDILLANVNKCLMYYRFTEIPMLIPIYMNRFDSNNQFCTSPVDIMKRIKFHKNNDRSQLEISWVVHSMICFSNVGNGKYYSAVNIDYKENDWRLFTNDKIPSMIKLNMKDEYVINKLQQECVVVFYRFDG